MDILFANPFFHPYYGGTEKVLFEAGRRLAKKHSVTVLTARLAGTPERESVEGMEVVRLPARIFYSAPHPVPPPVPFISGINSWLDSNAKDFDVIHVHNRFIFQPGFGRIAKRHGKKLALTIHNPRPAGIDPLTDFFGSLYDDLFAKRLMMMCDGISGVSSSALRSTLPQDYPGHVQTIYNGIDSDLFSPARSREWKEKLSIDGQMVLTSARLINQKGLRYLVEAMGAVDAELVVFGRGPLRKDLERRASAAGAKVHFVTERIEEGVLPGLYRSADCFALPSLYEALGIAALEAMSCGIPPVVTSVGGLVELVKDGKNGSIVPPKDPKSLAKAINGVLSDKEKSSRFARESRKEVLSRFTWAKITREYLAFYESL